MTEKYEKALEKLAELNHPFPFPLVPNFDPRASSLHHRYAQQRWAKAKAACASQRCPEQRQLFWEGPGITCALTVRSLLIQIARYIQLSQTPHNKAACSPHVHFPATSDGELIGDMQEKQFFISHVSDFMAPTRCKCVLYTMCKHCLSFLGYLSLDCLQTV